MSSSAASVADPHERPRRQRRSQRVTKRVVKKADGRYLIYYEAKKP